MDLVCHISKLFKQQEGKSRYMNAIVRAANEILAEFKRPDNISAAGDGFAKWMASDDTGMSSKYLACMIHNPSSGVDFAYPYDPDDFGRCYRMLRVCPIICSHLEDARTFPEPWPALIEHWVELERLYEEEMPTGTAPKLYARMKELTAKPKLKDAL
jgi:hypothetical protein